VSGPVPQDELTLADGSVMVLYSDGLVERRGEDLDVSLQRLRTAVDWVTERTTDVEKIADHLLHALGCAGGGDDDIALLVVR
jgi:serine/threonine protein phosphatase PrpC